MKSYIEQSKTNVGEYTIRLYGEIGEKVDGDRFAEELAYIAKDAELINLRINSPGGDVFQGMSIVSAMLSAAAPIDVYIDGIAASMAAVIAVCGERVVMSDYAKLMIHDPYVPGAKTLTAKQKKLCNQGRAMLNQVLSRRGIDSDKMATIMADETWFSAIEAKQIGLCDEITSSLKNSMNDLTPMQICAKINNDYETINQINQNEMKLNAKLAASLGVAVEATESELNAAIEKLVEDKTNAEKEKKDALTAKVTAETELKELKNQIATEKSKEADALIATAVKEGRLENSGVAAVKSVFNNDHTKGIELLEALPKRNSIHSQIGKDDKNEGLCDMSWDELDKNGKLAILKAKYPDVYKAKFNAKFYAEKE